MILNTGRTRDQWHTMTRTALSPRLAAGTPEPTLDIHPDDAARSGVADGALARIESDRGAMVARARITEAQAPGTVFVPIHWSDRFASSALVGALIGGARDPISGQPELKFTPVSVNAYEAAWYGFALTRDVVGIDGADWWARSRAANHHRIEFARLAAPEDWDLWARAVLGELHGGGEWLTYRDGGQGRYRFAALRDGMLSGCLFVASDPVLPARGWLAGLFARAPLGPDDRLGLLTGAPTNAQPDQGEIVCACLGVARGILEAAIQADPSVSVAVLGAATGAGTKCSSCRPELAQLILAHGNRGPVSSGDALPEIA